MNGTRFHYETGNDYMIKEYTSREAKFESIKHVISFTHLFILTPISEMSFIPLQIPPAIYTTPSEIEKHLSITEKKTQKLFFN